MAKKVARKGEVREVVYDETRWRLLDELRSVAIDLMEKLNRFNIPSIVYGSVARGDVSETSDVDIFVYNPPSSFILETALESAGIKPIRRLIVQATPQYAIKGVLEIDERLSVSFPLVKMRSVERGLYKFGGEADLQTLREGKRVCGVDKRLMLIQPTVRGHLESSVVGNEEYAAKVLKVPVEVVRNRVRILLRRDDIGRTGIFIQRELAPDETFELALKRLAEENPAVRRRLRALG
ncbi:hypothetical protein DRO28_00015 [Candidatus Bathyarchaeota archaeon]|nr:MAG: hypothetical protein DRO28_00015 [Candidatus Bathyarchaeota archaeon]